jgi:TetR/AcrR family transcriptional repressor of nem operon
MKQSLDMASGIDTRDKLLNSALDLIYARSYANVGVQELCEHAGVKKGSFYHFFPSKRDLAVAALERQWEIARQGVWDPAFTNNLSLHKKLGRCLDLFYQHQCEVKHKTGQVPGCPFGNLALELSTQDEAIRRKVDQIFRECTRYVERMLEEAIATGEIPKQDVSATAEAVIAYLEGIMLMAKTRNDPKVIKGLRQGLHRLLQAGPAITGKTGSGNAKKKGV